MLHREVFVGSPKGDHRKIIEWISSSLVSTCGKSQIGIFGQFHRDNLVHLSGTYSRGSRDFGRPDFTLICIR